jgi:hypothetical protein
MDSAQPTNSISLWDSLLYCSPAGPKPGRECCRLATNGERLEAWSEVTARWVTRPADDPRCRDVWQNSDSEAGPLGDLVFQDIGPDVGLTGDLRPSP